MNNVVSGLNWATFNTSNFNTIFGTGWDTQLGNYGCRANTSDDTSGTASGFGFSGTYYVEFKIWYVGTNNVGLIITLSDSGTKNIATANVLIDRATNTDIHSNFFSAYQYVNNRSMYPSSYTQYNGLSTGLANPVVDQVYFTAPQDSGGFAFLRFNCSQAGQIDFEILSKDNVSIGNVTYQLVVGTLSPAVIPMAKGSKLVCKVLNATVNWTDVYFNFSQKD